MLSMTTHVTRTSIRTRSRAHRPTSVVFGLGHGDGWTHHRRRDRGDHLGAPGRFCGRNGHGGLVAGRGLRGWEPKVSRVVGDGDVDVGNVAERAGLVRVRSFASAVLMAVAIVTAPLLIVAVWADQQITDTDRYVEAVSGLSDDPRVQQYVASELAKAFSEHVEQRHALMLAVMADRRMRRCFGDVRGKIGAMLAGDERQHHVERRSAARRTETVAVDLEQTAGRLDFREGLREAGEVLPMDRALIAVEQPGFGQNMGAGAHRADIMAAPVGLAQPGERRFSA